MALPDSLRHEVILNIQTPFYLAAEKLHFYSLSGYCLTYHFLASIMQRRRIHHGSLWELKALISIVAWLPNYALGAVVRTGARFDLGS